jgi:hypothetical protein
VRLHNIGIPDIPWTDAKSGFGLSTRLIYDSNGISTSSMAPSRSPPTAVPLPWAAGAALARACPFTGYRRRTN